MQERRKVNLPKDYKGKHWNCLFKDMSSEGENSDRGQYWKPSSLRWSTYSSQK